MEEKLFNLRKGVVEFQQILNIRLQEKVYISQFGFFGEYSSYRKNGRGLYIDICFIQ